MMKGVTFGLSEMHDCVVVLEEVDFVDSERLGSGLFDQVFDDFVGGSLHGNTE